MNNKIIAAGSCSPPTCNAEVSICCPTGYYGNDCSCTSPQPDPASTCKSQIWYSVVPGSLAAGNIIIEPNAPIVITGDLTIPDNGTLTVTVPKNFDPNGKSNS